MNQSDYIRDLDFRIKNAHSPFIVNCNFPNFDNLLDSLNQDALYQNTNNEPINLSTYNINTKQRKKIKLSLHKAFEKIYDSNRTDTKYSLISLNSEKLKNELNKLIFTPKVISDYPHKSINIWLGQERYMTSLHFDIVDGLLVQLQGRKRIILVHPKYSEFLYRNNIFSGGRLNFSKINSLCSTDFNKYPLCKKIETIDVIVEPGQLIYIPRKWWHEVHYLDDSISLNYWYDLSFNKGPTSLFLNILTCCPNSKLSKDLSDVTYCNLLNILEEQLDANNFLPTILLLGIVD